MIIFRKKHIDDKMKYQDIIQSLATVVKEKFKSESGGHDWWHIYRVWQLSKRIAEGEKADIFVVELAALLHDVADWKYNDGDEFAGGKVARSLLSEYSLPDQIINQVAEIIDSLSFKGAGVDSTMKTFEGQIVQDADRLDAIGAIGVARTFAYGGMKGRGIYDPEIKPSLHDSFETYKKSDSPTINHFYEKLLLLKDRMNTQTGIEMAAERHQFLEQFLNQFFREWNFENE
jgi:uncharacterized protein